MRCHFSIPGHIFDSPNTTLGLHKIKQDTNDTGIFLFKIKFVNYTMKISFATLDQLLIAILDYCIGLEQVIKIGIGINLLILRVSLNPIS